MVPTLGPTGGLGVIRVFRLFGPVLLTVRYVPTKPEWVLVTGYP